MNPLRLFLSPDGGPGDVEEAVEEAAEAIANVGDAIEEAREEAAEEIVDAAERAETLSQFDALNARLAGIESRLDAGEVPPAIQSQLDEIRQGLADLAEQTGGATAEAANDAIEEADEAAETVEEATEEVAEAVTPEAVEEGAVAVEAATEVEEMPRRAHLLFRRLGRGND